jgi:hypothetical protein
MSLRHQNGTCCCDIKTTIVPTLTKMVGMAPPLWGTTLSLTDIAQSTKRRWNDSEPEADLFKRSSVESNGTSSKCTTHWRTMLWPHGL